MDEKVKCKDCEYNQKDKWCDLYDEFLPLCGECYNW